MTQRIPSTPKHLIFPGRAWLGAAVLVALTACAGADTKRDTATGAVTDSASADSAGAAITTPPADTGAATADSARRTQTADTAARRSTAAAAATSERRTAAPPSTRGRTASGTSARAAAGTTGGTRTAAATPRAAPTSDARTSSSASATRDTPTAAAAPTTSGAAPSAGATSDTTKRDLLAAEPAAYEGWKTFHVYCFRCHGVDAVGGQLAPDLRHSVGPQGSVNHETFVQVVTNGRLEKGMPAWKELLTPQQIENLWAYTKARQEGRLAAGRPHRADQ